MLTIEERIAHIEKDLENIRKRREELEAEIYHLNKRKTFDLGELKKLMKEKEQERTDNEQTGT